MNIYRGQVDTNNAMVDTNGTKNGANGVNCGANIVEIMTTDIENLVDKPDKIDILNA